MSPTIEDDRAHAREMRTGGASFREIGIAYGVSPQAVSRWGLDDPAIPAVVVDEYQAPTVGDLAVRRHAGHVALEALMRARPGARDAWDALAALVAASRPPAWHTDAACRGAGPDRFYAGPGGGKAIRQAKVVCDGCPVRTECLETALAVNAADDHGVWGGTTAKERRTLRAGLAVVAEAA